MSAIVYNGIIIESKYYHVVLRIYKTKLPTIYLYIYTNFLSLCHYNVENDCAIGPHSPSIYLSLLNWPKYMFPSDELRFNEI